MKNMVKFLFHKNIVWLSVAILSLTAVKIYGKEAPVQYSPVQYSEEEKQMILSLVKPSPVFAKLIHSSALSAEPHPDAKIIQNMDVAMEVEILRDYSAEWYFVMDHSLGKKGWIQAKDLCIPEDFLNADLDAMSRKQLEGYVNIKGYKSDTDYLVWTDISRQLTYVFKGAEGMWNLQKTILCSTGKNSSPTIRGNFKIAERGDWFYSDRLESGAKYWVRFHNTYLYHSLSMDKNKKVLDTTLGRKVSSGCVRMSIDDAKWFYLTIPSGSMVLVH